MKQLRSSFLLLTFTSAFGLLLGSATTSFILSARLSEATSASRAELCRAIVSIADQRPIFLGKKGEPAEETISEMERLQKLYEDCK